jgi:hypothetical protein
MKFRVHKPHVTVVFALLWARFFCTCKAYAGVLILFVGLRDQRLPECHSSYRMFYVK